MRIGVDIDDTIADHLGALVEYHNRVYGTALRREQFTTLRFWDVWGGDPAQTQQKMRAFHVSGGLDLLEPIREALDALVRLRQRHELIAITGRTENLHEATYQWVDRHCNGYFQAVAFAQNPYQNSPGKTKGELCTELGISTIIEDDPNHAHTCAESGVPVLLLDAPWNLEYCHPVVTRVRGWDGIVGLLDR